MSFTFKTKRTTSKKDETISEICLKKATKHLDKMVKISAFIAAFGVLAFFVVIGGALIYLDKEFTTIAIGVFVVGVVISLITLFVIYGIGQIISQNNIILKEVAKQ